jgi:uncharacterized membrane protein YozB (DUF420 family)
MTRIVMAAVALLLALVAVYLGIAGRKDEHEGQGAMGAAWTILVLAITVAAYAVFDPVP